MTDNGEENAQTGSIIKILVEAPPGQRIRALISHGRWHIIGQLIVGLLAGLLSTGFASIDLIDKLRESIWVRTKLNSLDILVTTAYAGAEPLQNPVWSGLLKSMIVAGIFISLFVLFIWALVTLSRSTNTKAVDVAIESIKTLAGFFIGALTGFLAA